MNHQFKTAMEEFQEQEQFANQERIVEELRKLASAAQEQANAAAKQAIAAQEQANAATKQAAAAQERAVLAKQESESAKEEAIEAKRQSKINIWIAIAAVGVAVLSWIVPSETAYAAISAFFQSC